MSLAESMKARSFEVRCVRCEVTFPVETKRCIHCGGPTGGQHRVSFAPRASAKGSNAYSTDEEAFQSAYGMEGEDFVFRDETRAASPGSDVFETDERVGSVEAESTSPVKSLMRSLGGVIWILLLVGFSLARACGGE